MPAEKASPQSAKATPQRPAAKPAPAPVSAGNEMGGVMLELTITDPLTASPQQIMQLQQRVGNRAVQRLLDGAIQRRAAVGAEGGDLDSGLQDQIDRAQGGGQPLDRKAGAQIGGALGADFSGVRVHADSKSDTLNRSLNAKAFTLGSDIFFSQGAYNPGSSNGKQLLAHELTHVAQQGGAQINQVQAKFKTSSAKYIRRQVTDPNLLKGPKKARGSGFAEAAGSAPMGLLGAGMDTAATGGYIAGNIGSAYGMSSDQATKDLGGQVSTGSYAYGAGISVGSSLLGAVSSTGVSIEAHQKNLERRHGNKLKKQGGAAGKQLGKRMARHGRWGLGEKSLAAASGWTNVASGVGWTGSNIQGARGLSDDSSKWGIAGGAMTGLAGLLQMGGEGTGLASSIKAGGGAVKRGKRAKKFSKEVGADTELGKIAAYTSKKQTQGGRGLGIGKGILNFLGASSRTGSGAASIASAVASLAGNAGGSLVAGIISTAFSGFAALSSFGSIGLSKLQERQKKKGSTAADFEKQKAELDKRIKQIDGQIQLLTMNIAALRQRWAALDKQIMVMGKMVASVSGGEDAEDELAELELEMNLLEGEQEQVADQLDETLEKKRAAVTQKQNLVDAKAQLKDPTTAQVDSLLGVIRNAVGPNGAPQEQANVGKFLSQVLKIKVMKDDAPDQVDVDKINALLEDEAAFKQLLAEKMDKSS